MTESVDNLVKMANQIGQFFQSQTEDDPAATARSIAAHLKNFWAPAMRESLLDHAHELDPAVLLPAVAQALRDHEDTLRSARTHLKDEARETYPPGGGDAG